MARSPASSPGTAGAHERDDLVATKLGVPRTRPDRLARPRLLLALDQAMARELVLVCTPAGFGKTTLLADWTAGARWPVAWLSLDGQDNDPARFWRYVAAALERASPGVAEPVLSLLEGPNLVVSHGVVTALINQLQAVPREMALVLDDYHVIESPSVHDGMSYLLRFLPPQLHVLLASRSDPPLRLARLRAGGRLVELRAADLRFTAEESATLLRDVWRLDLSPEALAALEARTEGWAVGLQLAALSLRGRADPDAFLDGFTGTNRYVLDYLSEEVLERQPDRVRDFLLETSILERLSGPLCDAVTGRDDGQAMLEELDRANLFLVPLDQERRWWRLHHLFADLLRGRLRQAEGDRVPGLHRRAAAWCERHGLVDEAIRHAVAAGDAPWAARLVERHLGGTLRRGESVTLQRWLALLPDGARRSVPALCLAEGLMDLHLGQLASVERHLEDAERALAGRAEPGEHEVPTDGGMVTEVPAAIALLRSELASARGDAERTTRFARVALARLAADEQGPRLWGRWLVLLADWMRGRMEAAEAGFAQVLAEARAMPDPHPLTTSCHTLGWVQQARGRLDEALRTYQEGLRFATEGGRFLPFHAGEAHLGIAQVRYARNELEGALRHVTEGIELTRQAVEFQLPVFGLVALAWTRQAMGDGRGALAAIDEACRLLPASDVVSMFSPAHTERAGLLLAQGRVAEAAAWARERGLTEHDELSYPSERCHLMLARVLLASDEPDRALALLGRLDALAAAHGRTGSLIELRALRALAAQAAGDHQGALDLLDQALALAEPQGHVRAFADQGPAMAALLRSLANARRRGRGQAHAGGDAGHLHRVLGAFPPADGASPAGGGLVEPLTDRELEVLRLLATGRRNRDIARELVVTLETVKKHTSHILDKLGAANRTQAVARARTLGLIA